MPVVFGILWALAGVAGALNPIHLEARGARPLAFVDSEGREFIFHGTNVVVKGPPWHPDHTQFSRDISMAKEDFEWMQRLGLNFLRLGVMWPGTEPIRGQYNETYLDQIDRIVALAAQHGVYTMLDMHQDGLSEHFCGEGLPSWAVKLNEDHWYDPLRKPFPAPFDKFKNMQYYNEERHDGAKFPTRQACGSHRKGPGWYETTMAASQAYQALWDNWNGIGDAFAAMWAKVASRFKGRPEVIGLNLINEPYAGDLYHNPLIMIPWPSPTNADKVNLQPTYDKINAAVRAVDEEVLIFFAGVTWGDFGAGFTAAPGGPAFGNRSVLSCHFYTPPQLSADFQVLTHVADGMRLGTAAMITESGSVLDEKVSNDIADACDAHLQGWAKWEWKSFFRKSPDQSNQSQYDAFGAQKTGTGQTWSSDSPDKNYIDGIARTYAPTVAGSHVKMHFDRETGAFELQYDVGSIDPEIATEIFLLTMRYPGGANVSASASAGSVHVDYDGKGQWVRLYAAHGLKVGARVTVQISQKAMPLPHDVLV